MVSLVMVACLLSVDTDNSSNKNNSAAYDPPSAYHLMNIEGWDVYVHKHLLREEKKLGDDVIKLLTNKLYEIRRAVPSKPLAELMKVPIWLEFDNDEINPCACYHVSEDWLKNNGFLPKKAKAVEISSAQRFIEWTQDQPWMVLHELTHGYHDRVLGYDNKVIEAAFDRAQQSGKYEKVLRYKGTTEKHYALENSMEYFAESTEAFFGTNDYFPFVRAELKQHDPGMHQLMNEIWGTDK
ncbi:MAG: anthrax toxin lethal factor-related metalloendopeptidase [Pirellulales bacterium]|jgi:hypothetical protein